MLVINLIEKSRLSADDYSYSGSGVAWKARVVLFFGFALMAGGLAGSVVRIPTQVSRLSLDVGDQAASRCGWSRQGKMSKSWGECAAFQREDQAWRYTKSITSRQQMEVDRALILSVKADE